CDALFNYFLYYLREKPVMMISIQGTRQETRLVTRQVSDGNGGSRTETHHETHTVTDFNFSIDVSNYISNEWERVMAVPKQTSTEQQPVLGPWKAVLDQFISSKNLLKEIHMQKEVVWDYGNIQNSIVMALRMAGYGHNIRITFPKLNYMVSAYSDSTLSKATDSMAMKVFCVVTCLCIIFYPIFLMVRKNDRISIKITLG
ncbi:hypothetical protein BDR26DRAFT_870454, partial [Obelidium mucronatum]